MKPVLRKLIDRPHTHADTVTWIVLYILMVGLMGSLSAIVDWAQHGGEASIDTSIVVGIVTAIATALLFGALLFYNVMLRKALTRERAVEAERSKSEAKYRELFKESLDTVFILDAEGDFIDINAAGAALFRYDSEDDLVTVSLERDLAVKREAVGSMLSQAERHGSVRDVELALRRRDGSELIVSVNISAVRGVEGEVEAFRGLMRDITDKAYLERQVMNAQRMESIGKLARGIAHRFNDVITTIQGYSELAAGEVPPDGKVAAGLKEINRAADRAERLTRELLVFSRQQKLTPRPMNVNQLIESAREMMDHVSGSGIAFSTTLHADPSIVRGDSASIENMLLSMVMHSRERLRGVGEIRLTTGNREIDDGEYLPHHPDAHQGKFVTVTVEDNGPMIAPDAAARVFEPFNLTEDTDDGTGLEMSAVYGTILHHDGWVDIDSTPVRTCFTFYLPVSLALVEQDPDLIESVDRLQGSGERLLVVEDEEPIRFMAEKILTSNGYQVLTAGNANEAFRIYAREKGEFDAVLTDIVMPGESGISLADHLSDYDRELPIILTSGHETSVDDWQTIQDHGYHYLPKPYRLTDLLREVGKIFNHN